jgi:hypothetical protein
VSHAVQYVSIRPPESGSASPRFDRPLVFAAGSTHRVLMTITLITGANKGLGRETARRLLVAGHTVWIGARDRERGRAVAVDLGARFVQLDVTDDDSVAAAAATVERESTASLTC